MPLSLTQAKLVNPYKKENDPKVKERLLLLVIRVREDGQIPFRIAQEMHRSNNPWTSDWLKRYDKEGLEGLKDRTKSGRPPKLSKETSYQIKQQELKESNQGWTTKQGEELIIKKSSIKYHSIHIFRILRK